jgi:hypothetical protein
MSNTEPLMGLFVDAVTGETITRELTAEEISQLPKATDETPTAD